MTFPTTDPNEAESGPPGPLEIVASNQPEIAASNPPGSANPKPLEFRPSLGVLLLRRLWIVIVGAVLVGAIVWVGSKQISATYSSSSDVAVLVSGTDVESASLGANNLASQYAQMVTATSVLQAAGRTLGGNIPSSAVSAGSVAAQNLIAIKATGKSAAEAQARVTAVTTAFIRYVTAQVATQEAVYRSTAQAEIKPIESQIASTRRQLRSTTLTSSVEVSLQNTLSTLIASRAAALESIAEAVSAGRPTITAVSTATKGSETSPRPALYALVGFILALLILARLVTLVGVRGYRGEPELRHTSKQ